MEKVVIGLYEKTSYAERFAEYFCHNKNNCVDFRIFTMCDKISEFVKKTKIDVLLTDRKSVNDVENEKNVGKIIVLSSPANSKLPNVFSMLGITNFNSI